MSKTLSEELCEICGIVPKLKEDAIQLYDEYYKKFADKILPDFTKPENFVKLLEIAHQYLYFTTISQEETFVNGYLRYLINGLDLNNANGRFYYSEEIKQAIREADWVWE